ncbi:hypothetical protein SAMN05660489_00173 [Pseudomonas sp. LAMO17WK12:I10]|uniref:nucleoid-associated protein n=1 Tax=unclassified Pseudomonas TaxID=196821 RepID=UPI000BDDEC43|nr:MULTISPECIES: nucleoid-associated protein [unclassified Pseudomonas]PXX76577.1 nucleoid associated protein NdpA [Pseudomonas sp. LAMO17WK12:I9]SNY04343.1 hypothetical protein SAMN05660489_00173 [Pseudomonas sp. LAMO17WK12:I10]
MTVIEPIDEEIVLSSTSTVERIIFHIVGPKLKAPLILTEVEDPSTHSDFFIDRLIETTKGTAYTFNVASGVKQQISLATTSEHAFVDCSEILAQRFQELYENDKRLIPGVLMLLKIKSENNTYAAIIKYDDIKVISYKTQATHDGKIKPILDLILNTFVQDKKALQKSALINVQNDAGQLICIDRSGKNGDITDMFKKYLDSSRKFTHETLTDRLLNALIETATSNKEIIPAEILRKIKTAAKDAISSISAFNPKSPSTLLSALFGPLHTNEKIKNTFEKALKKQKILNETIKIPAGYFKRALKKVRETQEGVRVIYTQEHIDSGAIEFTEQGGYKTFKATTIEYRVDDEYHGKN